MKKYVILIVIVLIFISILSIIFYKLFNPSMKAVIVKINENSLTIMKLDETQSNLYNIEISNNNNFKQGQEIIVYYKYNTIIEDSYPSQIKKYYIKNIEILKEVSDVKIPDTILKFLYNSTQNISVTINTISNTNISIEIEDTNKYKYNYSNLDNYQISKKQNGIYTNIIDNTTNTENINNNSISKNYDWSNIYGFLECGEYQFSTSIEDIYITIYFEIKENGEITYKIPNIIKF